MEFRRVSNSFLIGYGNSKGAIIPVAVCPNSLLDRLGDAFRPDFFAPPPASEFFFCLGEVIMTSKREGF